MNKILKIGLILILIAAVAVGCYFAIDAVYDNSSSSTGADSSTSSTGNSNTSSNSPSSGSSSSDSLSSDSSSSDSTSSGSSSTETETDNNTYLTTRVFIYGNSSYYTYAYTESSTLKSCNISFTKEIDTTNNNSETLNIEIGYFQNAGGYQELFVAGTTYTITITNNGGTFDFCDYFALRAFDDRAAIPIYDVTVTENTVTATFTPEESMTALVWLTNTATVEDIDYNFNITITVD